jgi:hypothetical protein
MVSNTKKYNLRLISISQANYDSLRKFGEFGDSFNDVITKVLNIIDSMPTQKGVNN